MAGLHDFTTKEVLNKVLLDSSGDAVAAFSHTTQEALNAVLDSANSRLNVSLVGGTISGDVTISGDLTVSGGGSYAYSEVVIGDMTISDTTTSSSTKGGKLILSANDGAVMDAHHQLGMLDFAGATTAESTSGARDGTITSGARIRATTDTTWGGAEHGTNLDFFTSDGSTALASGDPMMRINALGMASIGTDNATSKVHIKNASGNAYTALFIDQDNTTNKTLEIDSEQQSGNIFHINNPQITTGTALAIEEDTTLTTGRLIHLVSSSATTNARTLFNLSNTHASSTGVTVMKLSNTSTGLSLHITDGGTLPDITAEDGTRLVVQHNSSTSDNVRMSLISGNAGSGVIHFGDAQDHNQGTIYYNHASSFMAFETAATEAMRIESDGDVILHKNLYHQAATVGHGMTGLAPSAAWAGFKIREANNGGLNLQGYTDADDTALTLLGLIGVTDPTDTVPAIVLQSGKKSGTSGQALAAAETVLRVDNWDSAGLVTVLGNGSIGIGTNSPDSLLELESSATTGHTLSMKGTSGNASVRLKLDFNANAGSQGSKGYLQYNNSTNSIELQSGGGIRFQPGGTTDRMILDTNSRISLSNNDGGNTSNTIFGKSAWNTTSNVGADFNVAIGELAMGTGTLAATTMNVAIGYKAMTDATTGDHNVIIGHVSGQNISTGSNNIVIGREAMQTSTGAENCIVIGTNAMQSANHTSNDGSIAIGELALSAKNLASGAQFAGATVAIGHKALTALTTGVSNTAIGYKAAAELSDNSHNTVVGYQAMYRSGTTVYYNTFIGSNSGSGDWSGGAHSNTAVGAATMAGVMTGTTVDNVAIGRDSLYALTSGASNTVVGKSAGNAITSGANNVVLGKSALSTATTALNNVIIGKGAGEDISAAEALSGTVAIGFEAFKGSSSTSTAAVGTVAIGNESLKVLTTGGGNTAVGNQALSTITTGSDNTAVGAYALSSADVGDSNNTAVGSECLKNNIRGTNTAVGASAMKWLDTGSSNVAIGNLAMTSPTSSSSNSASDNVAVGKSALAGITTGGSNVAIGSSAGDILTTGAYNTLIGNDADVDAATDSYQTKIGSYGIIKYKTARVSITKAHSGDNTVISEVCKIPALSIIHRVTATVITKSNLGTYLLNLSLSTSSGTAADGALANASTTITVPEILGAGGVATYAQNSATALGTAADIVASSGGADKTVYTAMPTTTIVGTADTFLYICNAGTGNGTTDSNTVVIDICVEYQGTD